MYITPPIKPFNPCNMKGYIIDSAFFMRNLINVTANFFSSELCGFTSMYFYFVEKSHTFI